jgi:hypothetical protein
MDDFLLDCCFNAIYEGIKFGKSTPRYAKRLRAMLKVFEKNFIADSALCNVKFNSKFSGRLRAMRHSAESTLRYTA